MFVRMPLTLTKPLRTAPDTDERIRTFFRELGYNLRSRRTADGMVEVGEGEAMKQFIVDSTPYHQALASKNLGAACVAAVRGEIERFTICYCVSSANETEIFVTRVNEGEVTVWIFQRLPAKLTRAAEHIAWRILKRGDGVFDVRKAMANHTPLELSTADGGLTVSHGAFVSRRFGTFLRDRSVEVALLMTAVTIGLITLLVDRVPKDGGAARVDPLPVWLRTFASATWPPSFYAAVTLLLTLTILYVSAPRRVLRWQGL